MLKIQTLNQTELQTGQILFAEILITSRQNRLVRGTQRRVCPSWRTFVPQAALRLEMEAQEEEWRSRLEEEERKANTLREKIREEWRREREEEQRGREDEWSRRVEEERERTRVEVEEYREQVQEVLQTLFLTLSTAEILRTVLLCTV